MKEWGYPGIRFQVYSSSIVIIFYALYSLTDNPLYVLGGVLSAIFLFGSFANHKINLIHNHNVEVIKERHRQIREKIKKKK